MLISSKKISQKETSRTLLDQVSGYHRLVMLTQNQHLCHKYEPPEMIVKHRFLDSALRFLILICYPFAKGMLMLLFQGLLLRSTVLGSVRHGPASSTDEETEAIVMNRFVPKSSYSNLQIFIRAFSHNVLPACSTNELSQDEIYSCN